MSNQSRVWIDDKGLYVKAGGYRSRPGGKPGHDHALDMSDGDLKGGEFVKARHIGGSPITKITTPEGRIIYWHNSKE